MSHHQTHPVIDAAQLNSMLVQEQSYQCPLDYLRHTHDTIFLNASETWRRVMCEWSYKIVDHFEIERDVVSVSMNYLDRYIAALIDANILPREESGGGRRIQLIPLTTLYMATKIHGGEKKLSIDLFVHIGKGKFKKEDIENMELSILEFLGWKMNPPSPASFVSHILLYLEPSLPLGREFEDYPYDKVRSVLQEVSRYHTELCVGAYDLVVHCKPSAIALGSILAAMDSVEKIVPHSVRESFLGRIYQVSGLYPDMNEVRQVQRSLRRVSSSSQSISDLFIATFDIHEPFYKRRDAFVTSPKCISKMITMQSRSDCLNDE